MAGLVMFIINGVINGAVLSASLRTWALWMAGHIHPPTFPVALVLWFFMSWLLGVCGVWVFARMAARTSSRTKAALQSGALIWVVSKAAVALDFIALGLLPTSIVLGQLIGGLLSILTGVYCGAQVYRD